MPWAMSWPGVIQAGTVIDTPVITLDILPTILDAASKPIDPDWALDGNSLLPLFGASKNTFPDRTLYWRRSGINGPIAMREGNWKLLTRNTPEQTPELYDIATDIGESKNVASENAAVLQRLQQKLDAWESELATPLWGPGSPGFVEPKKKRRTTP